MIKVIAFDFGGVLGTEANDWTGTFKKVLEVAGLSLAEMSQIWEVHWPKLKIGRESIQNYWLDAAKKRNSNPDKLRKVYNNSVAKNGEMIEFAKSLKEKYKLVILSNDAVDWMDAKIKKFHLNKIFDKIYCSGKLRIAKPDIKIFEYILKDQNITPDKLLFIDNQENNIEAANSLGIKTILFKDYKNLISFLP